MEQSEYTLPIDADEAEVNEKLSSFPKTVTADVEYIATETMPPVVDGGEQEPTLVEKVVSEQIELAVTWTSDKTLSTAEAGEFTYTATLSDSDKDKYDLAAGVSLPTNYPSGGNALGELNIADGSIETTAKGYKIAGGAEEIPYTGGYSITGNGTSTDNTIMMACGALAGQTAEIKAIDPIYSMANQNIKMGKNLSAIQAAKTATGVNGETVDDTPKWSETNGGQA